MTAAFWLTGNNFPLSHLPILKYHPQHVPGTIVEPVTDGNHFPCVTLEAGGNNLHLQLTMVQENLKIDTKVN